MRIVEKIWITVDGVSPRVSVDVHFLRQVSRLIAVESKLRLQFLSVASHHEHRKIPLFPPLSWARRTDTERTRQRGQGRIRGERVIQLPDMSAEGWILAPRYRKPVINDVDLTQFPKGC